MLVPGNAMTVATPIRPSPVGIPAIGAPQAPPLWLPGSHFSFALLCLLLGSVGLVMVAPELAAGVYVAPRVAATTHLFTLGWITTSIMGALYQFVPVALGQPIRSTSVAATTLLLYAPGLLAFVFGLATSRTTLLLAGALAFGVGVLLFAGNLALTLRASSARDVTWWALACATLFLVVTLVLGASLTGNLRWGYLGAGRASAIGVHLHVALAGWVLLVMIGVGSRLLPMFLLSHGASDRFAKLAVTLVASGAGMLTLLHHMPSRIGRWFPAVLIALGCVAFLIQARAWYAHRHRPKLDAGMRLAAVALALLSAAVLLSVPVVLGVATSRTAVGYVVTILLAISLFVAAHYYKIVPFLIWYHRFGPLAGKQQVPRVNELYSATAALVAAGLLVCGALGLISAVLAGAGSAGRVAATVLMGGVLLETTQLVLLNGRRP